MPVNKNKLLRLQTLLMMLRKRSYPNSTSFLAELRKQDPAGTYKLSPKTFIRDIADLRNEFDCPVEYDSSRKGFFLSRENWENEKLIVNPVNMKAVLLGERIASGILPEPLHGEIMNAVSSLLMRNETGMADGVEIDNFQVLNTAHLPNVKPEIFLTAYNAWEQHRYLFLTYHSMSGNRQSEKMFEPHIFAWNGGKWYIKGKLVRTGGEVCDPPKIQVLALHRIEKAELCGGVFTPAPEILKSVNGNGLFDLPKYPEVIMDVYAPADTGICERFADRPGVILRKTAECVTIRLTDIAEYEAVKLFFHVCGKAKIVKPEKLRLYVLDAARDILRFNEDPPADM